MDLFLQACGASGPLQLSLEWPGSTEGDCLCYDTPYVVVGRDPECNLVLEHEDVSERHAYLQLIGGRLYCLDLGSRGGTRLGSQDREAGWVEPREVVQIGPYRIRLVGGEGEGNGHGHGDGPAGLIELPLLSLDVSHRGFKASESRIGGGLALVGSSTECEVQLLDPGVSNVHCSLLSTAMGVWAVDLFGGGGIQHNGVPVRHAMISEGDELLVGRSTIQLRPEHPVEPDCSRDQAAGTFWSEEPSHEEAIHDVDTPRAAFGTREAPAPSTRPSLAGVVEDDELAAISTSDRRASCRYPVADVGAVMSWYEPIAIPAVIASEPTLSPTEEAIYARVMARWSGSRNGTPSSRSRLQMMARHPMPSIEETRKSCVSSARLQDISQTGMLVISTTVPPADQRIWLRLDNPQSTDWVEVVFKGSTPEAHGGHRVRLAFRESCPYDFFMQALSWKPGP